MRDTRTASMLFMIGDMWFSDDYIAACWAYEQALETCQVVLGTHVRSASILAQLAHLAISHKEIDDAARFTEQACAMYAELGDHEDTIQKLRNQLSGNASVQEPRQIQAPQAQLARSTTNSSGKRATARRERKRRK
jgi:hypothetical protein